jgi:hypothetical protein
MGMQRSRQVPASSHHGSALLRVLSGLAHLRRGRGDRQQNPLIHFAIDRIRDLHIAMPAQPAIGSAYLVGAGDYGSALTVVLEGRSYWSGVWATVIL